VQYQLIRHGTGLLSLGQIEGDINAPIDYSLSYPMKDFLNDGIYEWIHIARIDMTYAIPSLHASAWVEYAFVAASNYSNIEGNNVVKNLIGVGVKFKASGWTGGE
jgi:hypothetical protein